MAQPPVLDQLSKSPIFNTKAVVRESGVPADTFRAWERRYGVLQPQRTAGGHRLYSERDIAIIQWLRDRTAEGMNISHAVLLLESSPEAPVLATSDPGSARAIEQLAAELVRALIHFDARQADHLLSEAFALYAFERVLIELVQPVMVDIGELWHRGEINVTAEHFATQFVRRKLAGLLNLFEGIGRRATVVVGCAPGELHDLGALMSSLFLVRRGWHVIYLGPQVPQHDLIETVRTLNPALICLSASTIETATELIPLAHALREAAPQLRFGYGGRIFNTHPELCHDIPGTFLGRDGQEFVKIVETLLAHGTSPISE